jgi:peptidoglycan/xylan/chitin deacetylase (PgdA/CDA1 family)
VHTIILMYHGISAAGGGSANPHCISERSFKDQVTYLAQSDHPVLSWKDMTSGARQNVRAHVGLTFDDANQSDIGCARLLSRMGYGALFFIPTDDLGKNGRLGKEDLLELMRHGMSIGSHSHHHVDLVQLSDAQLEAELERSKTILEEIIRQPVEHIAFPGGSYNARVIDTGRKIGYRYFHTSDWGVNTQRQLSKRVLRRIPVVAGLRIEEFQDILEMRGYLRRQIQFHSKELAKRALSEHAYLKIRRAFLRLISTSDR